MMFTHFHLKTSKKQQDYSKDALKSATVLKREMRGNSSMRTFIPPAGLATPTRIHNFNLRFSWQDVCIETSIELIKETSFKRPRLAVGMHGGRRPGHEERQSGRQQICICQCLPVCRRPWGRQSASILNPLSASILKSSMQTALGTVVKLKKKKLDGNFLSTDTRMAIRIFVDIGSVQLPSNLSVGNNTFCKKEAGEKRSFGRLQKLGEFSYTQ
ncbi:hypothetical protein CEXT_499301 [Caerostris extrusa]|uniref:Uncharacterized protein n=1 Tax=Caerostris extrusa TaxID=172846 RepID=A0AAV4Y0A5_CAEEX|nr:hypothetical protein CEXT_499301 [Caerostris extrusa]